WGAHIRHPQAKTRRPTSTMRKYESAADIGSTYNSIYNGEMDLSSIPHSPGVYLMRDRSGNILYVGKAQDLAKRVGSYFMDRADHSVKIAALVASIHHVDYLPTESEREALVLEQGLIRRLQPNFNTMWRDDKSYPYLKLTWKEDFPRLFLTRKI